MMLITFAMRSGAECAWLWGRPISHSLEMRERLQRVTPPDLGRIFESSAHSPEFACGDRRLGPLGGHNGNNLPWAVLGIPLE